VVKSQPLERFVGRISRREFIENSLNEGSLESDSRILKKRGQVLFECEIGGAFFSSPDIPEVGPTEEKSSAGSKKSFR
jgi:hypothetical protein